MYSVPMTASASALPLHDISARPGRIEWATAAIFLGVVAFQMALALGAPWGRATLGGTHHGVLPTGLRAVSVGSAAVNLGFAGLATGRVARRHRRGAIIGIIAFSAAGVVANLATRSAVERAIWAPVTAVLLVLSVLMLRRDRREQTS